MQGRSRTTVTVAFALVVPCLALTGWAKPVGYESDVRAYNLAHGRVVFNDKCMRCHEAGRKGAPVLGDAVDWRPRVEQPLATLIEHAIEGHGDMPPRGDHPLTDQEVAAAVAFVVHRARVMIAADAIHTLPAPAAGAEEGRAEEADAAASPAGDPTDQAVLQMLLMLLGKDRWR